MNYEIIEITYTMVSMIIRVGIRGLWLKTTTSLFFAAHTCTHDGLVIIVLVIVVITLCVAGMVWPKENDQRLLFCVKVSHPNHETVKVSRKSTKEYSTSN